MGSMTALSGSCTTLTLISRFIGLWAGSWIAASTWTSASYRRLSACHVLELLEHTNMPVGVDTWLEIEQLLRLTAGFLDHRWHGREQTRRATVHDYIGVLNIGKMLPQVARIRQAVILGMHRHWGPGVLAHPARWPDLFFSGIDQHNNFDDFAGAQGFFMETYIFGGISYTAKSTITMWEVLEALLTCAVQFTDIYSDVYRRG